MTVFIRFLHILSIAIWIGGMTFFSFIAAPSIFKVLSRDMAGKVVGDIFPKYWMLGYICSISALVTMTIIDLQAKVFPSLRFMVLLLMTVLTFYSGMVIGKKAREIKAELHSTIEESAKSVLQTAFKKYHAISTGLNVVIIFIGIFLIFLIARDFLK